MSEAVLTLGSAMAAASVRILLLLIFLQAGLQKLRHLGELEGVVQNYRVLPDYAARPVSIILPFAELAVAAGLLINISPWAELSAAALLGLFAAAMAVNVARGRREIDCGCFSTSLKQVVSGWTVSRNCVLAMAALLVSREPGGPLSWAALGEVWVAGAVLFLIYATANTLDAVRARAAALNFKGA